MSNTNGNADTSIFVLLPIIKNSEKNHRTHRVLTGFYLKHVFFQGGLPFFLPPPASHRAFIRDIIPLPATQGFPAEVTTGCRPFIVDGAAPSRNSAPIRLLFLQVPAGGVSKKIIIGFLKAPLAEVTQIVGFAFTDRYYGEPAAAFAATAAGTGDRGVVLRFHAYTGGIATRVRVTD